MKEELIFLEKSSQFMIHPKIYRCEEYSLRAIITSKVNYVDVSQDKTLNHCTTLPLNH